MGRHSDRNRRDTNPFGQIFRDYEPAHTGFGTTDDPPPVHTVPPIERTDGDGIPAITSTEPDDGTGGTMPPFLPPADEATEYIRFGAPPVKPFEPDPEPYPVEPPPDVNQADDEPARRPRAWLLALGLSGALCAALAAGAVGRATAPGTPVSDAYSPRETVTVTATPTATAGPKKPGGQPRPTVTAWRTRTPKPEVRVSPVPGPTVRVTQTVTPKPLVSVRVSKVPVPGPTKTVECVITITVNRSGIEVDRETSGVC